MCGWGDGNDCNSPDRLTPESGMPAGAALGEPWPMINARAHGNFIDGIDDSAQQKVRDAMVKVAKTSKPEFVISVGDNFYPGGVIEHCNGVSAGYDFDTVPQQFNTTFEMVYDSPELEGKEWMSVLGNHDYGGTCMQMGWPQQIWYTWNTQMTRWVMPAQYYSRRMWFDDISVDIFYLDSNIGDGDTTDRDHDLCTKEGNAGDPTDPQAGYHCSGFLDDGLGSCPGTNFTGDTTGRSPIGSGFDAFKNCHDVFRDLWDEQLAWLDRELAASDADWQFLVTHFPPYFPFMNQTIKPLAQKHGVDLVMTGHSHEQMVKYKETYIDFNFGDVAWVVSGGGGGITSEGPPTVDHSHDDDQHHGTPTGHDDQYGFMDITVRRDTFTITAYSYLPSLDDEPIVRSTTEVTKNEPITKNEPSTVEGTTMIV
jgi:predicted phosphodiesterase